MEKEESFMAKFIVVLLWIVRIWSLLIVVVVLIFFLGEEVFGNESPDVFNVPIIPLIAGIFMLGGLLIAWKWEITGGIISLIGFTGIQIINAGNSRTPIMYILFALPAILYILCGVIRHYYLPGIVRIK